MKLLRYQSHAGPAYGVLEADGSVRELLGSPFERPEVGKAIGKKIDELILLPPVDAPKCICVGLNYKKHIEETNAKTPEFPMLFMKPRTALVGHGAEVVYPKISENVHYEAELVAVIGKRGRWIPRDRAKEHVLGYSIGNDISARDWQRREMANGFLLWGKGFDTFGPIGPVVDTEIDASDLRIQLRVDGQVKQDARTSDLLFDVPYLVAEISRAITLEPGDCIMTGTPSGVGPVKPGEVMEVEIEGIGVLRNPVVAER
ncbi:MAG TPA: fumarylacetoacetate hydrolase family protein [Chloroflexota bacterium]|jgi:2-keto-4-pentenoate hydratase/2-oxohepta-3-ene-1,7-dioic acid hydratase in catechol pathway|nr:fumarylacetoacetate hydrolase family protein [Chloroflexota bacterium]